MFEKLVARIVDFGEGVVDFKGTLAGELFREVLACIKKFQKAADCVDVIVWEVDCTGLLFTIVRFINPCLMLGKGDTCAVVGKVFAGVRKVGALCQQSLMGGKDCWEFAADGQADDGAHQVADEGGLWVDDVLLSEGHFSCIDSFLDLGNFGSFSTLDHLDITTSSAGGGLLLQNVVVSSRHGGSQRMSHES